MPFVTESVFGAGISFKMAAEFGSIEVCGIWPLGTKEVLGAVPTKLRGPELWMAGPRDARYAGVKLPACICDVGTKYCCKLPAGCCFIYSYAA